MTPTSRTAALATTLVSAEQLMAFQAKGPPPVVVDASFDLADVEAGRRAWREGHVPGSVYLHLDDDLSGTKNGRNGRHPLPERTVFAALLGRLGITPETQVVALDRQGGVYAARVWWMLRWMGHDAVAVLDGGVAGCQQAGGRLVAADVTGATGATGTTGAADAPASAVVAAAGSAGVGLGTAGEAPGSAPSAAAPPYPERPPLTAQLDADALLGRLGRVRIVDARAPERFRGEVEPLDAVAGHIPGACNRFHRLNLEATGRFKPAAQLREEFEALLGREAPAAVVHQCGSGVTACHNLLAMEHAGLTGSVLYPGSWSEWSADPGRPIARG